MILNVRLSICFFFFTIILNIYSRDHVDDSFRAMFFFQLIIWPYGASCLSGMVSAVRQIRDARAIRCPFGKYSVPFQSHHSFKNLILVWVNRVTGASFYFYTHTNSSSRELKANAKKIANQYISGYAMTK